MYSFELQRVVRMCDPVFSKHKLPFKDPSESVLINADMTDEMVVAMHHLDCNNFVDGN